jgi:hypothetical protein
VGIDAKNGLIRNAPLTMTRIMSILGSKYAILPVYLNLMFVGTTTPWPGS